ncbi:nuclear transport factor 2 family protein [uncultured Roseobacter sp.]|uniref:nuclear transport factor 2 family protein n=1 Tax=uncultured Roseobacter sp. TaxID=114847 RepID=UPI00261E650D|nr:nuclear transport factor 2 family protein [uncultured Roseobacter sp.]
MTNAEIVADFFKLQYAGDYAEGFKKYGHSDFTFVTGSADNAELRAAIPWAGYAHIGMQGYEELYQRLFGEFDVEVFEPRSFVEGGDKVYVEGHFRFRHKETGKIADSDWCARFDMKDGKIIGGQFFENTFGVADVRLSSDD